MIFKIHNINCINYKNKWKIYLKKSFKINNFKDKYTFSVCFYKELHNFFLKILKNLKKY